MRVIGHRRLSALVHCHRQELLNLCDVLPEQKDVTRSSARPDPMVHEAPLRIGVVNEQVRQPRGQGRRQRRLWNHDLFLRREFHFEVGPEHHQITFTTETVGHALGGRPQADVLHQKVFRQTERLALIFWCADHGHLVQPQRTRAGAVAHAKRKIPLGAIRGGRRTCDGEAHVRVRRVAMAQRIGDGVVKHEPTEGLVHADSHIDNVARHRAALQECFRECR
mmetsp:Transcript_32981/g.55168  ORF Transcript_32981/g.55168 Transcript_32981/m.55168 type:complete len:222 (+) Transcript_32981:550-1215(+)